MRLLEHSTKGYHIVSKDGFALKLWDKEEAKELLRIMTLGAVISQAVLLILSILEIFIIEEWWVHLMPIPTLMFLYPICYILNRIGDTGEYGLEFKNNESVKKSEYENIGELLPEFKKVFLMEDGSVKFAYELINVSESRGTELVIELKDTKTLEDIKDNTPKYKAMLNYQQNEVLPDDSIIKLLEGYLEIIEYNENKASEEYYAQFLSKKGKEEEQKYIKQLEDGKNLISEDLIKLKEESKGHLEDNSRLIKNIRM